MKNVLVEGGGSSMERQKVTVLELEVNNHPGVMSHICGLFSRRAYNLEGIVCMPLATGEISRMWLQVNEYDKLDQIVKQVEKLPDVLGLERHDQGHQVFGLVDDYLGEKPVG